MNFFKSVFSDDPEPTESESSSPKSDPHSPDKHDQAPTSSDPNPNPGSRWDFGGLIKTLTIKSESVIETYRRDLQEFGSGLKKEIEVAHGSLGTVGHAIDELSSSVIKGTAHIITHGKEVILSADLRSEGSPRGSAKSTDGDQTYQRYSRFDAQVRAIQSDAGTYCDEPEDLDDYRKWKSGFDLGEKGEEIRILTEENDVVMSFYEKVVPGSVDHDTFWCRYFYRMHKLEQAESFRARLVSRAISSEEEELSWDVDDDEDDDEVENGETVNVVELKDGDSEINVLENSNAKEVAREDVKGDTGNETTKEGKAIGELQESQEGFDAQRVEEVTEVGTGEKIADTRDVSPERRGAETESEIDKGNPEAVSMSSKVNTEVEKIPSKEGDTARVGDQPSASEEEDLGWDEIEDLSGIDDQKASQAGDPNPNRAELRKRLSAAEDEEDLSWDIEDDDESAKA